MHCRMPCSPSISAAGQVGLSVSDGETEIFKFSPVDFADASWFGQWVSKDLGVYVDVTKQIDAPTLTADVAGITVKGGTKEGSVYLNSITIDYEEGTGMALESPLGWIYEKLDKKSKLNEGDELMIFRNGCAAADIDDHVSVGLFNIDTGSDSRCNGGLNEIHSARSGLNRGINDGSLLNAGYAAWHTH